jgi:hypothetical protein
MVEVVRLVTPMMPVERDKVSQSEREFSAWVRAASQPGLLTSP